MFISTDQGHTWSHFGSHIPDWYDSMQYNNSLSPFYGQMAWDGSRQKGGGCGANTSFIQKSADFSHLAGRNVMLRFTFFSDTYFALPAVSALTCSLRLFFFINTED